MTATPTARWRKRVAHRMRIWADRLDVHGAPKRTSWRFTYEDNVGIVFRDDGRGCKLWYYGDDDFDKAHTESDSQTRRSAADRADDAPGSDWARHAMLDHRTHTRKRLPDGRTRHTLSGPMIATPPEYAAVYRRRGLPPPVSVSAFDPASLWPYEPRRAHRDHAMANGYFWMPCPLCGLDFGGHEICGSIPMPDNPPGVSTGICPRCTADRNGGTV